MDKDKKSTEETTNINKLFRNTKVFWFCFFAHFIQTSLLPLNKICVWQELQIPAECEIKIQNPNDSGLQMRIHDTTYNSDPTFIFLTSHQSITLPTARVNRVVEIETIDCLSHQPVQIISPTPDKPADKQPVPLPFTFELPKDGSDDTTLFDDNSFSWSCADSETDNHLEVEQDHKDDDDTSISTIIVPETGASTEEGNSKEQCVANTQNDYSITNTEDKQSHPQQQPPTRRIPSCNLMVCALGVLSFGMFTSLLFPRLLFGDLPCMSSIHPS